MKDLPKLYLVVNVKPVSSASSGKADHILELLCEGVCLMVFLGN